MNRQLYIYTNSSGWHITDEINDLMNLKRIIMFSFVFKIMHLSAQKLWCKLFFFMQWHTNVRLDKISLLLGCYVACCGKPHNEVIFQDLTIFYLIVSSQGVFPYVCAGRAWILMAGFTLSFGSMFSKTYRVHSIFTNVQLNKKVNFTCGPTNLRFSKGEIKILFDPLTFYPYNKARETTSHIYMLHTFLKSITSHNHLYKSIYY